MTQPQPPIEPSKKGPSKKGPITNVPSKKEPSKKPTDSSNPTTRELAVQQAIEKMADKAPQKAVLSRPSLTPISLADPGRTLPYLQQPLIKGKKGNDRASAALAKNLKKLGIETVGDLLRHYPRRYGDPGALTDIAALVPGEHVTVMARVQSVSSRAMSTRAGVMLQAVVTDGNKELHLTFFAKDQRGLYHPSSKLRPGRVGLFTGVVSQYRQQRQLTHPDFLVVGVDTESTLEAIEESGKPIPIYPATAGLATWKIQRTIRTYLATLKESEVPDPIPSHIREALRLPSHFQALFDVHHPGDLEQAKRGFKRLRYEEAFVTQAALVQRRAFNEELTAVPRPRTEGQSILGEFDRALPFTLTAGQIEVGEQISADLARTFPMQRLLQGDVGSGKTVVALRAMLQVVANGGQAALLAPTEVLAAQHARSIEQLMGELAQGTPLAGGELRTEVALLTGSLSTAAKREALLGAASGAAGIVVGTHALLSDHVQFADLGLVVVDEQHRFGVEQRDALRAKGLAVPHLLVMTATPIPRTVAMTVFGDLETSTMTELPAGRPGIDTFVVRAENQTWMNRTWQRAREEIAAGRRVYVVCPRITPVDQTQKASKSSPDEPIFDDGLDTLFDHAPEEEPDRVLNTVYEVADLLNSMDTFSGVSIGVLHGQLPPAEKDQAMADFAAGRTQLLVSTTVIEVGVDVKEASVMIILDADRYGMSQLHQLRGRIGRGKDRGICLMVAPTPQDGVPNTRLAALAETTDGFKLAAADLELRSEGDVLGAAQSGRGSSLKLLRVIKDADLIAQARKDAESVFASDPHYAHHEELAQSIALRLGPDRTVFLDRS